MCIFDLIFVVKFLLAGIIHFFTNFGCQNNPVK